MARKYLGDAFDIHGGGVDLRFPHHENEQAQSRAAGLGFANYWLHNAWVTIGGEKMSKSLGNSLLVSEIIQIARPLAVRYYLSAAHYRSTIEYHEGSLREAEAAVERIEGFVRRALPGVDLPGAGLAHPSVRAAAGRVRRRHGRRPQRVRRPRRRPRDRAGRQHRARRGRRTRPPATRPCSWST